MKCTNRKTILAGFLCVAITLGGCGRLKYDMPYDSNAQMGGFHIIAGGEEDRAKPFASDLCVVSGNINPESIDMSQATAAVLFDVNDKETLYAKGAHEKLNPASLTKVMTALVALKNGSLEQILTATDNVKITESGAQLCGIKTGDTMTLEQALHVLLIYSANDVAMLIAENVGGTVEHFVELMNEEAGLLGATNTHFTNPHGLTDTEHYSTAYDLYLMLNEAMHYDKFTEIIHKTSYQMTYYDQNGAGKELNFESTNRFFRGHFQAPENINIIGGKTGTTSAAGHCLMLLSKDAAGAPYISVILQSEESDILYQEMVDLLGEINK
ncbi:MAG: D-alanyl-D-alanine carboxypeptidase [Roseburia sp.]|nr:D-alanyl-D-alanine carboxypeptidase [Roseburia sp.]